MYKEVKLKSCNKTLYDDIIIKCKVLKQDEVEEYVNNNCDNFFAYKNSLVKVRKPHGEEKVHTKLLVLYENNFYILKEETYIANENNGDIILTNVDSYFKEEYVSNIKNFNDYYVHEKDDLFISSGGPKMLFIAKENLIIETGYGAEVVCLKGSFIVRHGENDFNVLEKYAFYQTYQQIDHFGLRFS